MWFVQTFRTLVVVVFATGSGVASFKYIALSYSLVSLRFGRDPSAVVNASDNKSPPDPLSSRSSEGNVGGNHRWAWHAKRRSRLQIEKFRLFTVIELIYRDIFLWVCRRGLFCMLIRNGIVLSDNASLAKLHRVKWGNWGCWGIFAFCALEKMKICYRIDLHTRESLAVTGLLLLANTLWGRMKQKKHINFNCRHLLPYTAAETQSHKLQRNPCSTFKSTIGKRDTPKVAFIFLLLFYVGNQFPVRARYNLGDCCIFVFRSSLSISTLFRCAFYRQPFFLSLLRALLYFSVRCSFASRNWKSTACVTLFRKVISDRNISERSWHLLDLQCIEGAFNCSM